MNSGGEDRPSAPSSPVNGGEFLLTLLRRPTHQPPMPPLEQKILPASQNLSQDPAVAALGPTIRFPPIQSSDLDPASHSHPPPPFAPHSYYRGYSQKTSLNPNSSRTLSSAPLADSFQRLGLSSYTSRAETSNPREQRFVIGSSPYGYQGNSSISEGDARSLYDSGAYINGILRKESKTGEGNLQSNKFEADFRNSPSYSRNLRGDTRTGSVTAREGKIGEGTMRLNGFEAGSRNSWNSNRNDGNRLLKGLEADFQHPSNYRRSRESIMGAGLPIPEVRRTPPGFGKMPSHRNGHGMNKEKSSSDGLRDRGFTSNYIDERERRVLPDHVNSRGDMIDERRLRSQLDCPGPPAGSTLHSASAFEIEESLSELHREIDENEEINGRKVHGWGMTQDDLDDLDERVISSLEDERGSNYKNSKKRDKNYRSDTRGQRMLTQRMRNFRRQIKCRSDIDLFSAPLLAIYESLTPLAEEKMKQRQLLASLEKLVTKEWPEARLLVYGSCANSFGVSKSDIDICLAIDDADDNKAEVLLKLADILKSENLENVQALTHARVPIVKLMDPVTGISCDICVNNLLAVVNSKLLRDYAKIDGRLRQLAFIVKHWAKCRRVNETYHGTLSSYAYVLMCIHFLQLRTPAILPCLQGMDTTYAVTVDNIECAFFDQVDTLSSYGSRNRESIAQLVWAFFSYWAYSHEYAHHVVSVRSGRIVSKRDKDWTRRIGNDRHLICIEDPFEITHDLGRVVDKKSIKVLREEFERAAEILHYDPNPCVTLFEPYIP